jgi:hypothetical protein
MNARPRTIVGDLADWDLPTLEDRLDGLINELKKKKLTITLDEDTLGEQFHAQIFDRVRKLGAAAANEAIWGWLQGVADGCPELCVEFPYLNGSDKVTPLTLVYAVGAKDGSRTELRRVDLENELMEAAQSDHPRRKPRARVAEMGSKLRGLADKLEAEVA